MKKSFLPIQLFTFYDEQRFNSFNDIKTSFNGKGFKKDYFGYIVDCLKNYEKQHLFDRLLIICPFIFFSNENKLSKENLKRHLDLEGTTIYAPHPHQPPPLWSSPFFPPSPPPHPTHPPSPLWFSPFVPPSAHLLRVLIVQNTSFQVFKCFCSAFLRRSNV